MTHATRSFLFMNVGHALDHYCMLIFTTAVLTMEGAFGDTYGRLLLLTTWSFVFFGGASIPAGWLGDRWSRRAMMVVFFLGLGGACIGTAFATGPLGVEIGLALIGAFAAIYHPIGIALVVEEAGRTGRALGINGVWGNLGVAFAAVGTGALADAWGWRAAFVVPGVVSIVAGVAYAWHLASSGAVAAAAGRSGAGGRGLGGVGPGAVFVLVAACALFGGVIFNATTITLPKIMAERMAGTLGSTFEIGGAAAVVFAVAALAQVVVGELLDRVPILRLYLALTVMQVLALGLALSVDGLGTLAAVLPLMFATFGLIPMADWLVARGIGGAWRSRVYALKSVLGLGIGAIAVQLSGRLHASTGSFDALFVVLAACASVVLVTAWVVLRRAAEPVPSLA